MLAEVPLQTKSKENRFVSKHLFIRFQLPAARISCGKSGSCVVCSSRARLCCVEQEIAETRRSLSKICTQFSLVENDLLTLIVRWRHHRPRAVLSRWLSWSATSRIRILPRFPIQAAPPYQPGVLSRNTGPGSETKSFQAANVNKL